MYKQVILNKILEYLQLKKWQHRKAGKILMVKCPICNNEPMSAQRIPHTTLINCFNCKQKYTLIDFVKAIEPDYKDKKEEDILQHLKEILKIDIVTEKEEKALDNLFTCYENMGFDLVPIIKNGKRPIEKDWTNKSHKSKEEWFQWIHSGLNIGVKTGQISGITVIDIDQKPIPKEIQEMLKNTPVLTQETNKGYHLFFQYEPDLPKTRIDEYKIDIENDGGQVVIQPSKIDNIERKWVRGAREQYQNHPKLGIIPESFLKLLQSKITVPRKTQSEKLREDIEEEKFNLGIIKEGQRSNSLVRLGGVLRKQLNINDTHTVLSILNKYACENPLATKEITAMTNSLDKYVKFDQRELAHEILEHLKEVNNITKSDLELAINGGWTKGEAKKRFNKALQYLIKEDKILLRGKKVELVKDLDWDTTLFDVGVPINFKVPYLNDYAFFNWTDVIVIASKTKFGKTTLAMNIIKKLVDQGVKPYYIYSETGGRFAKTALKLGIKDDQFEHAFLSSAKKLRFPKRMENQKAVIIYDWLRPDDFAKTDEIFEKLVEKVKKINGFLIVFMQLKKDNSYFAENLLSQYPALVCKYLYEDEKEGTHTKFQITEIREGKIKGKEFDIPCQYIWETKEVKLISELENG